MKFNLIFLILFFSVFLPKSAITQTQKDFSFQSNYKARQVLEKSIKAYGGKEILEKTRNFSVQLKGKSNQLFQGISPQEPHILYGLESQIVIESNKNRLLVDTAFKSLNSDYVFRTKEIIEEDKGFTIFLPQKWVSKMESPSLNYYQNSYRLLPQNILSTALKQNSTLRWLGNDTFDGRKQSVIALTFRNGRVWNLFFDSKTFLLTKYTSCFTRNTLGDMLAKVVFKDYKNSQCTKLPTSRIAYQGGILVSDFEYHNLIITPKIKDSIYNLPSDLIELNLIESKTKMQKLDKNVYLLSNLSGGFNILAVEFEDFILTVEAPEGNIVNGVSAKAINLIKNAIPNKPIKYSVITHHHGDHSAGIRAFISDGAKVITTQGNSDYIKRLTKLNFTFSPDLLSQKPNKLQLDLITNEKKVISDNLNSVEIYQIGPIHHSKEMLMIYLPKQKILFQSDLYNPIKKNLISTEDDPWHGINKLDTLSLFNAIKKLNLDVKIIAGAHGRISTIKELKEDVQKISKN